MFSAFLIFSPYKYSTKTRESYTSGFHFTLSFYQTLQSTVSCFFLCLFKNKEFFPTNRACFFYVRHCKHAFSVVSDFFNIRF